MICVKDRRSWIDRVLKSYGLPSDTLELVPSVYDWCVTHAVPMDNPGQMAICACDWDKNQCHIVMCEQFTSDDFFTLNSVMRLAGFRHEVQRLDSDDRCLLHLLLHEIACHVLKTTEQKPRDKWAFAELGKHAT